MAPWRCPKTKDFNWCDKHEVPTRHDCYMCGREDGYNDYLTDEETQYDEPMDKEED